MNFTMMMTTLSYEQPPTKAKTKNTGTVENGKFSSILRARSTSGNHISIITIEDNYRLTTLTSLIDTSLTDEP